MNIVILTTLHSVTPERSRLTELFLDYYAGYGDLVAVTSTVEEAAIATDHGWSTVVAPNNQLSTKWAAGMCAINTGAPPDAVMIVGSDDFMHPSWVDRCAKLINEGADMIVPRSCYLYDAPTGRACYMTKLHACGAGRVFSTRLLDKLDWCLWDTSSSLAWLPATAQERRLKKSGVSYKRVTIDPHDAGIPIVDVKCGDNLNSYDDLLRKTETMDIDPVWLWSHFPEVGEAMLNWKEVEV